MKERKGNIKWGVSALLILLTATLVIGCSKTEKTLSVPTTEGTEPAVVVAEQTEETTQPETTVPVEETTVPAETEEETTESTTASTTAPSTTDKDKTDEKEEDFGDEEPYWEGPDPGTLKNPYMEVLAEYPAEVESVKIPIDSKVSYIISGSAGSVITIQDPTVTLTMDGKTYKADKTTGKLIVDLSRLVVDPIITLAHSVRTATAFVLNLTEGWGDAGNPEVLTDPAELLVQLPAGDSNGYHYQWVSQITGKVELMLKEESAVLSETDTAEVPVDIPTLEIIVTVGEETIRLSESEDGKLIFDTIKDQKVQIQVIAQPFANGAYPAIEETVVWTLLPAPGTEENPEVLESLENLTAALAAGDSRGYYCRWTAPTYATVTLKANDLNLSATVDETCHESENGELTFHADKNQTVLLHVTQEIDEDAFMTTQLDDTVAVTATVQPDPGTPENPVVCEDIASITASVQEGDLDGYTAQWTTLYGGILTLTADNADAGFDVVLTNKTSGDSSRLSETADGKLSVRMEATDVAVAHITAAADENGEFGAAEVTLTGSFAADPGSSPENPIMIGDTDSAVSVAMEVGQTLYFSGVLHERVLNLENAYGASIHYGEETIWTDQFGVARIEFPAAQTEEPVNFSITGRTRKDVILSFGYPEGHEKNPAPLNMGTTKITLAENDTDGYRLSWIADCDGELTVAVKGDSGWQYQLDDLTTNTYGQRFTGNQETVTVSQTIQVKVGTKVQLTLWTQAPEAAEVLPAGQLTVEASFYDPLLGTEEKPVRLLLGQTNTVKIPAGKTMYYVAAAQNMVLHFGGNNVVLNHNGVAYTLENGTAEVMCHGAESVFAIAAGTETDEICTLRFAYPVGHPENPAQLLVGENTAVPENGSFDGYTFIWNAEAKGILTVTMSGEKNWQYMITNETTDTAGELRSAGDETVITSESVEVKAGDRLRIFVNTSDDQSASEVKFTAAFVPERTEPAPDQAESIVE